MLSIVLRDFIAYTSYKTVRKTMRERDLECLTSSHDFLVLKKKVSYQLREFEV